MVHDSSSQYLNNLSQRVRPLKQQQYDIPEAILEESMSMAEDELETNILDRSQFVRSVIEEEQLKFEEDASSAEEFDMPTPKGDIVHSSSASSSVGDASEEESKAVFPLKTAPTSSSLKKESKKGGSKRVTIQEDPMLKTAKQDEELKLAKKGITIHPTHSIHSKEVKEIKAQSVEPKDSMSDDGSLLVYYVTNLLVMAKYEDSLKVIE